MNTIMSLIGLLLIRLINLWVVTQLKESKVLSSQVWWLVRAYLMIIKLWVVTSQHSKNHRPNKIKTKMIQKRMKKQTIRMKETTTKKKRRKMNRMKINKAINQIKRTAKRPAMAMKTTRRRSKSIRIRLMAATQAAKAMPWTLNLSDLT